MPILYDNSANSLFGSATFSYTNAGNILFVGVVGDVNNDIVTAVSYNSVSMTQIAKIQNQSNRWIYLYYLLNPAQGANNIVETGYSSPALFPVSYFSAKQSGQPDSHNSASAASSTGQTVSTTVVASNCWTMMFSY